MESNKFQLRPYQEEAVEAGVKFLKGNENTGAIIVAPTASGKSWMIAAIANELEGNTIVLQPSREILVQNYEKMALYFGEENIGVFSASAGRKDINKITFATIGTLISKKEMFNDFQHLIIDETHAVNAKGGMYEEFIKHFGGKVLGLSATPYRLHSYADMKTKQRCVVAKFLHRTRPRIFSKIINITQIQELYEQGYLCPVDYELNSDYNYKEIKLNSTGLNYDQQSLDLYNEKKDIVKIVKDKIVNHSMKHFLVFTTSVKEAVRIREALTAEGVCSEVVSSDTNKKDREQIIKYFKDGSIKAVINFGTMTTGFDFPELDCVILARPTQSVALYQQMIGRVIRIAPNKKIAKVIDLCGNVERFGKIETFEIVTNDSGLHRLKSNKGFLTGYDFVGHQDLELIGYAGKKEAEFSKDIMPFGKHKGLHLSKLPSSYIDWCIENLNESKLKQKLKEIKQKRDPSIN